ncbi:protein FAM135A isoform X2 [Planococcus citri]|uniref:protein FAM135A isoform X2 n=1 Tax=Planococcus citri TaxID=170843 RepID=UPI0031F9B034
MAELQATVEFAVELCKFYNIDLYQRGFYRIRTELKVSQKLTTKIETSIRRCDRDEGLVPASVENNAGISKTFRIIYRNEEITLDDIIVFRVHVLVDSNKIEDILNHANFCLTVELWFTNQSLSAPKSPAIGCVSSRTLHLQFACGKGLHYHLPVIFDYFYLSAITITIHANLIALHQPYIKKGFLNLVQSWISKSSVVGSLKCKSRSSTSRSGKPWLSGNSQKFSFWLPQSTMDNLFSSNNVSASSMKCVSSNSMHISHIQYVHSEVCSLLLNSYESLRTTISQYSKLVPPWQRQELKVPTDFQCLRNLDYPGKISESLEEFVLKANNEIAQLCAENILLWQQFLDTFCRKDGVQQYLAKQHHQLRVRRFAEAFFLLDNPRQSAAGCFDQNYHNYVAVSEIMRRSKYWQSLPTLPVYCAESDGDLNTLPIIFEDHYEDIAEFARKRSEAGNRQSDANEIKQLQNSIGLQEDCSCGIAEILESRSQRLSQNKGSKKRDVKNFHAEAEDVNDRSLAVKLPVKQTSSMEYLLRNDDPSSLTLETQFSYPPTTYCHYNRYCSSQCVCYQATTRGECCSQYDLGHPSTSRAGIPYRGYANTIPLQFPLEYKIPSEAERPYPRRSHRDRKSQWVDSAGCSSGYQTDGRYHYEENGQQQNHYAVVHRSHRNTLPSKSGTSKSNDVDAYFVDTLNKSMAESKIKSAKSLDHFTQPVDLGQQKPEDGTRRNGERNDYQEYPNEKSTPASRTYTPSKTAPSNKDDSSSDSCGSTFVPVKSTSECQSAPYSLEQLNERRARSSSMCSMPELVNCSFPHYIMNSESMPNITSKNESRKLLYASQINSSTSLSESDNMSERSGYVSSHKTSAGSTNQVTPTGHEAPQTNMQKLVSCDTLKEKLDKLVKQSKSHKKSESREKDVKITISGNQTTEESLKIEIYENDSEPKYASIYEIKSDRSCKDMNKPIPPPPVPTEHHELTTDPRQSPIPGTSTQTDDYHVNRDSRRNSIKRSESCQAEPRYVNNQRVLHYDTRTSEIRHLDTINKNASYQPDEKPIPPEKDYMPVESNGRRESDSKNHAWKNIPADGPVYAEIDRKDPKRITKRYINRKKFANEENANQEVDVLPPCQFRDAPPPPEAFRDPPEPIDNILYYVVESVNENREANRRRECEEAKANRISTEERRIPVWKTECGSEANVYKLAEYVPNGYANPDGVTFEVNGHYCDTDTDPSDKLKHHDIYDKNSTFNKHKEEFKQQINFTGTLYSDFPTLASTLPYFHLSEEYRIFSPEGVHLIVCVHGLDGSAGDLRLVRAYLELGLPGANLEFLMSERNQGDTFSDFERMTDQLVTEVLSYIAKSQINPEKISFIGHSLGAIVVRSAIARPQMKHLLPKLHTFMSLSGPHLGILYNGSGLINMGVWFMQKVKKSGTLLQLSLRDASNIRNTFLYRLSQKCHLSHFRHVLLFGSSQDRYVPLHSARIELCKAAIKDTSVTGTAYREMVQSIIQPIINKPDVTFVRYDVHHLLPTTANSLIGRAAHIALLDSDLFIEKFFVVTGLKYFR